MVPAALDDIAGDAGMARAVDIHAVEIAEQPVAPDQGAGGLAAELDAGVEGLVRGAGPAYLQPADLDIGREHRNDAADARSRNDGPAPAPQRERAVDLHTAFMDARSQQEHLPRLRGFDGGGQRAGPRGHLTLRRQRGRSDEGQRKPGAEHHTALGSTNIRPRISMWSAWQNHWQ